MSTEEVKNANATPNELIISLHALVGISSQQILKIRGFIKHKLVAVLIESGIMHNFVHKWVNEVVHCFAWEISQFSSP